MIFDFSRHWNAEPVLAYTTGKNKTDRSKSLNIRLWPIKLFFGTFSDQVHDLETDIFEAVWPVGWILADRRFLWVDSKLKLLFPVRNITWKNTTVHSKKGTKHPKFVIFSWSIIFMDLH